MIQLAEYRNVGRSWRTKMRVLIFAGVFILLFSPVMHRNADANQASVWSKGARHKIGFELPVSSYNPIRFSPDSKYFYFERQYGKEAGLRSVETGEAMDMPPELKLQFAEFAISDNGEYAVSRYFREAKVWSYADKKEVYSLPVEEGIIDKVSISYDGEWIAVLFNGGSLFIINWASGAEKTVIEVGDEMIFYMSFSPDGQYFAVSGFDCITRVWRVSDGKKMSMIPGTAWQVPIFSHSGRYLVCQSVYLGFWSVPHGAFLGKAGSFSGTFAISPAGEFAASVSHWEKATDESPYRIIVGVYRIPDGKLICTLAGHEDTVSALAFSRDGSMIATGGKDQTVILWSFPEGNKITSLTQEGEIKSIAFSPNGKLMGVASGESVFHIWEPEGI